MILNCADDEYDCGGEILLLPFSVLLSYPRKLKFTQLQGDSIFLVQHKIR